MGNRQDMFDLIIVGFGLVGSSFVLALQHQGLKIAVIEKQLPEVMTDVAAPFRPLSLAYGSVEIFRTLAIWEGLQATATPIKEVVVCEEGVLGAVHFHAKEANVEALGFVVSFSDLCQVLYHAALQQTGVDFIAIQKIKDIQRIGAMMHVFVDTAEGERELRAPLVVGCDGAQSSVRQLLNMEVKHKQSEDVALTGIFTLAEPYCDIAVERFTKMGVIAILPLANPMQCGVVITLPKVLLESRACWTEVDWLKALMPHLALRIPKIVAFHKGHVFPLQWVITKKPILPGVILLGNAAHTLYPLAAQGFNLGLRDAAALAEILVMAKQKVESLGEEQVLQQYVTWRQKDQKRTTQLTALMAQMFKIQFPGASILRGLGLLGFDVFGPMKKKMVQITIGLDGSLPKLMRGLPLWEESSHHET